MRKEITTYLKIPLKRPVEVPKETKGDWTLTMATRGGGLCLNLVPVVPSNEKAE